MSADHNHGAGRELVAALHHTHARAEETLREAHALHERGFEPMQVAGLPSVPWHKDGRLYTTETALSTAWAIREDS
jgi:hypothetical protein